MDRVSLSFFLETYNDKLNIFEKRDIYFIYLNVNGLLYKMDEISYIVKLTNASKIGLSETKLDHTAFDSESEIKWYDLVRFDRTQREGSMVVLLHALSRIIANLVFALMQRAIT